MLILCKNQNQTHGFGPPHRTSQSMTHTSNASVFMTAFNYTITSYQHVSHTYFENCPIAIVYRVKIKENKSVKHFLHDSTYQTRP
jgi:precorrin-4 methylase